MSTVWFARELVMEVAVLCLKHPQLKPLQSTRAPTAQAAASSSDWHEVLVPFISRELSVHFECIYDSQIFPDVLTSRQ
jgi:hypothetical protein